MRPTNKIGDSHEEEMNLILEFILNFDVNRLLYAINGKKLREEDIRSLTIDIREYLIKLERQKEHLFRFGKTFNKEFAHEDNKCFDTSIKLSRRMRSGLSGIKNAVFKPFVKVSRKRLPDGMPNPSIMNRSMISTENYCADLYGLASYPDSVKDLFCTMLQFYEVLDDCIEESKRVLKEEKVIKADERLCLERLVSACEKSKKNQLHIIEAIENDPAFKESLKNSSYLSSDDKNPVLKSFKKNSMSGTFARAFFHNCSPKDIGKITLYKAWNESNEDPMMMLAHTVFGNDDEKIRRINYVIASFDKLLPEACKRKVIPAYHLYVFMEWCGNVIGIDSFLNYFEKYYKSHGGKWKVVGKTAINGAKNRPYNPKYKKSCDEIKLNMLSGINSLLSIFGDEEMTA
jgi:hypothetical protein